MKKGYIVEWNDRKGFGFIRSQNEKSKTFFHVSEYKNRGIRPTLGSKVNYSEAKDARGRTCAVDVYCPNPTRTKPGRSLRFKLPHVVALGFLAVVIGSSLLKFTPIYLAAYYGLISVFAYFLYYSDKSAAQSKGWRVSERALHLIGLLGGWPGALLAQTNLRHKTRKGSFVFSFWLTVALNIAIYSWLHTAEGSDRLSSMVSKFGF